MKKFLFALTLIALFAISSFASEVIIGGYFQGENLLIINPSSGEAKGFCIQEIDVNGKKAILELRSSSLELDLSQFDLRRGDSITVNIKHKDGCTPRVVNEDALRPVASFTVTTISVDAKGVLHWTTIEEQGKLPYRIETYRWGKWITIGEVLGFGSPRATDYKFDVYTNPSVKPNSGKNLYRVYQMDYRGRRRYSLEATFVPQGLALVSLVSSKKYTNEVTFTSATSYEVVDETGNVLSYGFGTKADISKASKVLYVNFDSQTKKIKKK